MDANLFIKSYKTEGNKVKEIEFNGDWVIETGGGSSEVVGTTDGINSGTLADGITTTFIIANDNVYKVRFWNRTGYRILVYRIDGYDDYSLIMGNNSHADLWGTKGGNADILRLAVQVYNGQRNGDFIGYVYADYDNGITVKENK